MNIVKNTFSQSRNEENLTDCAPSSTVWVGGEKKLSFIFSLKNETSRYSCTKTTPEKVTRLGGKNVKKNRNFEDSAQEKNPHLKSDISVERKNKVTKNKIKWFFLLSVFVCQSWNLAEPAKFTFPESFFTILLIFQILFSSPRLVRRCRSSKHLYFAFSEIKDYKLIN